MRKEFLPALIWSALIMVLCGIPGGSIPEPSFWKWLSWDKLTHLFLFGTLTALLLHAERKKTGQPPVPERIYFWIFAVVAYGAIIEVLQSTVFIDRSGDVRDALANAIGAVSGGYLFRKRKHAQ